MVRVSSHHCFYLFGFGGLLSRPVPDGFPVVLGLPPLPFDIIKRFDCYASISAFRHPPPWFFKWTSGITITYIAIEIRLAFPS